jgi:hypothetical protein
MPEPRGLDSDCVAELSRRRSDLDKATMNALQFEAKNGKVCDADCSNLAEYFEVSLINNLQTIMMFWVHPSLGTSGTMQASSWTAHHFRRMEDSSAKRINDGSADWSNRVRWRTTVTGVGSARPQAAMPCTRSALSRAHNRQHRGVAP